MQDSYEDSVSLQTGLLKITDARTAHYSKVKPLSQEVVLQVAVLALG